MAKKIIMGVLFLALVGALVAGAVNRTAAKSADTNSTEHSGAGWARFQEDGTVLAANVEGRGGRNRVVTDEMHAAGQSGQGQRETLNTQQGGGGNGQAAGGQGAQAHGNASQGQTGNAQGQPLELAAAEDHQWETISGVVRSIDDTQMTVQTGSGEIVIADRPWSFALESGFSAHVGEQIILDGFYEDDVFEAGRLTNGDQVVSIREESGRPLWAGRGRWSAQGQGRSG